MKLSDYVLDMVVRHGVHHVFLVPGGAAMHLNDSLGRRKELSFVGNLHEQASAVAAEAYARVTGGLGVCMVTSGPGSTNAITGVLGAWLDSTPVLFLSGQVKTADLKGDTGLRMLGVQEVDIVTLVKSITKYAVTITDPAAVKYHVEKALHLARSGRPGPVWIDIPLDVQGTQIDLESQQGYEPAIDYAPLQDRARAAEFAQQTLDLLRQAERPAILAGNGIRVAGAVDAFTALIEALGIPVLTTWLGLDLIPDAHPLFAGRPGAIAPRFANFAVQNCDFLLTIGSRLDMATVGYSHERFARAARKVVVDIDNAEIDKLKMPVDVAANIDARLFIEELLKLVSADPVSPRADWLSRIQDWKRRYPLMPPAAAREEKGLSAYVFSQALSDAIPEGSLIVPGSSGFAVEIFLLMLQVKAGQRCFHNRGTGAMGLSQPAALGACLGADRKLTISVDGDGGFQFNSQELATIAHLNLPIKMFVLNNGGYASIRSSQNGYFGGNLVSSDPTSGLVLPELEGLAKAYGVGFQRIVSEEDLVEGIRRTLDSDGPVVCEIVALKDEPREPRLSSTRREDGSMASKPIEDLFPFLDRAEYRANMIIPIVED